MSFYLYLILGFIGGIPAGMGMGGGTVLIPMLTLLKGIPQHTAQAINLISFIPMAAVALVLHIKNKLVDFDGILYMIVPGAMFSATFSYISANINGEILSKIFGGFLVLLAFVQFFADKIINLSKK